MFVFFPARDVLVRLAPSSGFALVYGLPPVMGSPLGSACLCDGLPPGMGSLRGWARSPDGLASGNVVLIGLSLRTNIFLKRKIFNTDVRCTSKMLSGRSRWKATLLPDCVFASAL